MGQFLIRLAKFVHAVCVGTILGELAVTSLLEELAHLRLVVVIRNVEHLVLHLEWKFFILAAHLVLPVSEVATSTLHTGTLLHEVPTKRGLVEHVQLICGRFRSLALCWGAGGLLLVGNLLEGIAVRLVISRLLWIERVCLAMHVFQNVCLKGMLVY